MKKLNMILKEIELNSINFSDDEFLISYPLKYVNVKESIEKIGLINPPLLVGTEHCSVPTVGKFKIVSGFKRVFALRDLDRKTITCFIISNNYTAIELLQLAIFDNSLTRQFNPIEKSIIINKLSKYVSKDTIINEYFEHLGLEPSEKLYVLYEPLINLEDDIKLAIANNELSDRTGANLLGFVKKDRLALFDFLIQLKPSVSKQNEIIELVFEISKRENIAVNAVIKAGEIDTIFSNQKFSIPQKLERVREYLKKRRYPQLTKLEEDFESFKKSIGISQDMKFYPPAFFEGNNYEIHLSFSKISQLKKQITILHKMIDSEKLKNVIER